MLYFFNDTATTEIYTLSLHDALPISIETARRTVEDRVEAARDAVEMRRQQVKRAVHAGRAAAQDARDERSEEHTSELQSRQYIVCRLLLEKKIKHPTQMSSICAGDYG